MYKSPQTRLHTDTTFATTEQFEALVLRTVMYHVIQKEARIVRTSKIQAPQPNLQMKQIFAFEIGLTSASDGLKAALFYFAKCVLSEI